MTDPPLPDTASPVDALSAWRARLVRRVIQVSALAALLPSLLVTWQALRDGLWLPALVCWLATGAIVWLGWARVLPHRWRAAAALGLLYAFGCWLLLRGSAVSTLYFLACPVMCVLGLGLRPALAALAACCSTLAIGGAVLNLPFPVVAALADNPVLRWLVIATNLLTLGLLLTLSTGYLLRHLEQALLHQAQGAQSLQRSEALLREVASQIPGMVFRVLIDEQGVSHFLYVSPGSRDVLNVEPEVLMADASVLRSRLHPDDLPALRSMVSGLHEGQARGELQLRVPGPRGTVRWVQVQSREVERHGATVVVNGVITDITARKAAEDLVWQQAHFDTLTGLPNRLTLQADLTNALTRARRDGSRGALLMVDLDRFKEVNDTLGHACGDQLLAQAGQRLQACVRDGDIVARMGGDEFVLLLPVVGTEADVERVAQRVLAALADAFELPGERAHVSASIGVALFPQDGEQPDDLLMHADQALYQAKDAGRNRVCRFTSALRAQAQQRLRLGNDLRNARADGQLSLVYQPIVDLRSGRVCKAEALLRWQHPELGAIAPAQFIPVAEATGQIHEIGEWVFHTALQQVQAWRRSLDPGFQISINRSPVQFRADGSGTPDWPSQLAACGLPGDAIVVEITEGMLLDDGDHVRRQLQAFRRAGMPVSLDDFGTGYSALAYLHRFELDVLKIDRSFVSGDAAGPTGRSLCRAMVLMSHELGLQVVAEGVETAEQRDWLQGIGCDHAQGWLFGRPMPAEAFEQAMGHGPATPGVACTAASTPCQGTPA